MHHCNKLPAAELLSRPADVIPGGAQMAASVNRKGHPYGEWITTYGSPEYEELPEKQEELLNAVGLAQPYGVSQCCGESLWRRFNGNRSMPQSSRCKTNVENHLWLRTTTKTFGQASRCEC